MLNTVYVMWLRQIKRYWRSKSRIIGSIGQPLLFLVAMGYGLGSMYAKAEGGSYINFLAPGVMSQAILFMAIFSGVDLIWDRQFGFLKETIVAPVSRFEIVLGRVLGGATIATFQGMLVFSLILFLGFRPEDVFLLPVALVIMFLVAFLYTSLGTAIASVMKDFHGFQLIMNFLVMPTFFLSGAMFPLNTAPYTLKVIAKFNPLSYGVDGIRNIMLGNFNGNVTNSIFVLAFLSVLMLSFCSYLFSKMES